MYEDYWQLRAKPFEPVTSAEGFFPSEAHQGALLKLQYAIDGRRAAAVLSGPSGVGKTLLAQRLIAGFAEQEDSPIGPIAHLVFPQMAYQDLLAYLAAKLGSADAAGATLSVDESVRRIENRLRENHDAGRHAVIVLDEAQLLEDTGLLETIRLLLNLGPSPGAWMTLLLVGQMGLLSALARRPALEERLAVKSMLRPLTAAETGDYLRTRLEAVGATREVFEPSAVEMMHCLTGGVPRRIDRLGDLSLVVGYADGVPAIDADQIKAVSQELLAVSPE
ncbi:MAG: AAA family ATPase [Planctomycetota bacterium]